MPVALWSGPVCVAATLRIATQRQPTWHRSGSSRPSLLTSSRDCGDGGKKIWCRALRSLGFQEARSVVRVRSGPDRALPCKSSVFPSRMKRSFPEWGAQQRSTSDSYDPALLPNGSKTKAILLPTKSRPDLMDTSVGVSCGTGRHRGVAL